MPFDLNNIGNQAQGFGQGLLGLYAGITEIENRRDQIRNPAPAPVAPINTGEQSDGTTIVADDAKETKIGGITVTQAAGVGAVVVGLLGVMVWAGKK